MPEDELSGGGARHSEAECTPRARAADDLSGQGSGLRARQAKGGSHAPEIPTPTPAVNLRFDIDACKLALMYSTSSRMGTGISEASKRVPIFSKVCYPGRQACEFPFSTGELGQNFKAQTQPAGAEPEPWMMIG